MKKPLLLFVSILAASPAFAMELPKYLQEKLDDNAASTAFQLKVNDTIEKISKEKNYRELITKRVDRDLHGWERTVNGARIASSALGVVGAGTFVVGSTELPESSVSSTKAGITNQMVSGTGAAMSVASFGAAAGMVTLATAHEIHNVLNEGNADEYASSTASRLAGFFRLPKNKELALKFAIKEEIYRKDKEKDLTPMNLTDVIKNAKVIGKPILSEKEVAAFTQIQAELEKTKEKSGGKAPALTGEEKIGYLIAASAMLETQVDINAKRSGDLPPEIRKARDQAATNRKILAEIEEYRKNLGDKVGQKDKEDDDDTHDAE